MTELPTTHPCPDPACAGVIALDPYAESTDTAPCPSCGQGWQAQSIRTASRHRTRREAVPPIQFADAALAEHYARTAPDASPGLSAKLDLHRYHRLWYLAENDPDMRLGDALTEAVSALSFPGASDR
jgi:hypothetical protein